MMDFVGPARKSQNSGLIGGGGMRKRAPGGGSFRAYIYFPDHHHRPHPVERKKGGRGMPGMMGIGGAEKNFED